MTRVSIVRKTLLTLCVGILGFAWTARAQTGISNQYPGDTGIGSDPDVLFYEDFNDASLNVMAQNWTNTTSPNPTQMQLTQDPAPGSADGQALKMMTSGGMLRNVST